MNDSFEDGWNGFSLDVFANGNLVLEGATFALGAQELLTFPVNEGDDITTAVNTTGSFDGEVSYRILDALGNEVGSGNASNDIVAGTITASCPSCTPVVVNNSFVTETCNPDGTGTYTVTLEFESTLELLNISLNADNTEDPPIVGVPGLTTVVGPFDAGTPVDLYIINFDSQCSYFLDTFNFDCPKPQDNCNTAESIGPGTYVTTITQGSSGSVMGTGGDSAFFVYTPTEDGEIYVNSCNGGADTFLNIGNGVCADLTSIASNDDSCASGLGNNFASEITIPVTAGVDYYIEWDDRYGSGANEFTWTLEFIPPPACPAPTDFTATRITNPDGVLLEWTPGGNEFIFDVSASQPGATEPDGTFPEINTSETTTTFTAPAPGETLLYWVRGRCSDSPSLVSDWVSVEYTEPLPAPDNDDCANATEILCGQTINATSEGSLGNQEGSGCSIGDNGIWFTFTGTGGDMTVAVDASFDHEVAISTGVCGDLTNIVCDDQSTGTETHTFASELDAIYYVYVADFSSFGTPDTGTIDISLSCAAVPTCQDPSDLAAINITGTSADLAWTENGTATVWDIELVDVTAGGTATGTPTNGGVTNPTTLTGLTAGNSYEYYVRADCGGDTSAWVGPFAFTTAGDCSTTGTFSYGNNSDASNSINFFVDTPGDIITLTFTAGSTESCCDQWFVTDGANGTGSVIDSGFGSIVGSYESTTGEISFYVDSDGSITGTTFEYSTSCTTPSTDTPDFFNLQFPATGDIIVGDEFLVFAQVFEGGLTDTSSTPASGIEAWIGYSTVDSSPDTDSDWTWIPAATNPGYDFSQNNDEYFLDLGAEVPGVGTYYYASRWSLNNGPFVYGGILPDGTGGGEWGQNGWASGVLTVSPPPAPDNDLCENATPINCGDTVTGSTANATSTLGNSSPDVFYSLEGTVAGEEVTVSLCGSSFDTFLRIFDVCGGEEIASNDDNFAACGPGNNSQLTFTSDGATTYIIVVEGFGSNSGDYNLEVTCVPPPTCPVPTDFAPTTQTPTITTFTWTPGGDETSWEFAVSQPDATEPEPAIVVTEPTANAGHNPGQTILYWVRAICGPDNFSDWVTIEYTSPLQGPDNDDCEGALPLECGVTVTGNTEGATASGLDASCGGFASADALDLFYTFEADGTSSYTVSLTSVTSFDGVLFVYSGPCDDLTSVACSDSGSPEEVVLDTPAAGTYTVRIFDYFGTGDFALDLTCEEPPACTPAVIEDAFVTETCNPDGSGTFNISIDFDTVVEVSTVSLDPENTQFPPEIGFDTTESIFVLGPFEAGTPVDLYVNGFDSDCSFFIGTFNFDCPQPAPDNDLLADAIPVACGDTVLGTTINATLDEADAPEVATVEPDTNADVDSPWVWYSFTGNGSAERVTLSTCGTDNTDFDTEIFVYTGTSGDLTLIDDGFDECGGSAENFAAETSFDSDGSTTYFIAIGGWNADDVGNFQLAVTCEILDPCDGPLPNLVWTGAEDSNWENAGNWENSEAPGLNVFANVNIPSALPNYPILTLGQDLYIGECSTIFVDDFATINFRPNVVLTNDGTLATEGPVTFESDETGTAYIGSGVGVFIGDDYTVERFIPAKRAYRQLSPAVTTTLPISENWQQDTHITGPAGNTDGFDVTETGNPSAYIFDNVVYDYIELPNTNATNLIPGTMYHILVRGDRTTDLTNNEATPSNTTLRATGELTADNAGSQTISVDVPEQRFVAVGNPFQAQVDMNAVLTTSTTNISPNFYWVWDPNLGTRGAYATVIAATGSPTPSDSDADQFLQAGQAGWVFTADAGPSSVTFTQDSKNTGVETSTFRNENAMSLGQLQLSLYESGALANNGTAADGVMILFDTSGNNGVDANDAPDITNLDENFAINNDGTLLSIETRAQPTDEEEVQLEVNTYRSTNYTIVAQGIAMEDATAFLVDNYTGAMTEIPQSGSVDYSFTVDSSIAGSIANDRFKIVFAVNALSVDTFGVEGIELYPNPSKTGKFFIDVPAGMDDLEVTIYSLLGVKLYSETGFSAGQQITIDTDGRLSIGTYVVELSSNGKTTTKKLIIN
jgi:hypothetical protein